MGQPVHGQADTETLVALAGAGDTAARQELLARYRARLRRMIALRMDRRLASRLDPSDVVQEALIDAGRRLDEYLIERPLPFYPWLRQFAWNRLVDGHRRHVRSGRRSVAREAAWDDGPGLSDESVAHMARALVDDGTNPSTRLAAEERRDEVRAALEALPPRDREVLVMRYLEQMAIDEIAAALGLKAGAVKARMVRALLRMRARLGDRP